MQCSCSHISPDVALHMECKEVTRLWRLTSKVGSLGVGHSGDFEPVPRLW